MAFAGDGVEEICHCLVFIGFAEIELILVGGLGEEIEEDEDLFFGEDTFCFT